MNNKIVIIGVYFGTLPTYFSAWLESCRYNPTIDFMIFSDCEVSDLPSNVKIYPLTIAQMQRKASDVLGFEACLERPYKCCDYKVIYGLIFKEYISEYEYWGYCDFDMIFGDLQSFFDRYELYKYDRFLTLGHLCLYRNTQEVNRRYLKEGSLFDYKTVYTTDQNYVFDENNGLTRIYLLNNFTMFKKRIFADIATVYHRYRLIECYPYDKKPKNYKYQVFSWQEGKVYRYYYQNGTLNKEEYIYIHFQKRPKYNVYFDPKQTKAFYITNKGFFEKTDAVTMSAIREYNPYPGGLYEAIEKARFVIRKYAKRVSRLMRRILTKNEQR